MGGLLPFSETLPVTVIIIILPCCQMSLRRWIGHYDMTLFSHVIDRDDG